MPAELTDPARWPEPLRHELAANQDGAAAAERRRTEVIVLEDGGLHIKRLPSVDASLSQGKGRVAVAIRSALAA